MREHVSLGTTLSRVPVPGPDLAFLPPSTSIRGASSIHSPLTWPAVVYQHEVFQKQPPTWKPKVMDFTEFVIIPSERSFAL